VATRKASDGSWRTNESKHKQKQKQTHMHSQKNNYEIDEDESKKDTGAPLNSLTAMVAYLRPLFF
jgi:hypothetical protein